MLCIHPAIAPTGGACEPVCAVEATAREGDLTEADAPLAGMARGYLPSPALPKAPGPALRRGSADAEHDDMRALVAVG